MRGGLTPNPLGPERMAELDRNIAEYLGGQAEPTFDLVGAGELTCVISWQGFAFKLLPPVADAARVERYAALLDEYLVALRAAGVPVVDTSFATVVSQRGAAGYIVQPLFAGEQLLSAVCARSDESTALTFFERLLDHVDACVEAGIGIDPQLTNWMLIDGEPRLVDVTTPMLRDDQGRDRLDTDFFVMLLPRLLQGVVRRFMVADLLEKNFDRRQIVVDLVGMIANCGLEALTEPFIAAANRRLADSAPSGSGGADPPSPLSVAEIRRYRREDAATWWVLRRAFAAEQAWRRLTRAPALHLVPAHFDRTDS